jgi:hypothetical protein
MVKLQMKSTDKSSWEVFLMKITAIWNVASCSLAIIALMMEAVNTSRRSISTRLNDATAYKTVISLLVAVRIRNLTFF